LHTLPLGFVSLLTTNLLSARGKVEAGRFLASVSRRDLRVPNDQSLADWLGRTVEDETVRQLVEAFIRVSTYVNAPTLLSARAGLEQLQLAFQPGVWYLDGGWQALTAALEARARALGVRIERSARVTRVTSDGQVRHVYVHDGVLDASAVVLAVPPAAAQTLLADAVGEVRWTLTPAKAACLDVALSRLPNPGATFALGIDRPLYYSVHSATAAVARGCGAVIHVAKYLDPFHTSDARANEEELESFLEKLQPRWRSFVEVRRFLPSMTVTHAAPTVGTRGVEGRPAVRVNGVSGILLAGDWVGSRGQLANCSVSSAASAAEEIKADLERKEAA
jgi:phytoene dehydrogenase-like protein